MGSSYVEFKNKGFWSRDGTIELWERLLVLEIDKLSNCPEWLQDLRNHWGVQSQGMGVGCNYVGLDDHITTEERRQTLVTLAHAALSTIEQYGEFIPKAIVNTFPTHEEEARWTRDVDIAFIRCFAVYFVKLLNGEYPLTGSDWGRPIEWLKNEQEYYRWLHLLRLKNSSS